MNGAATAGLAASIRQDIGTVESGGPAMAAAIGGSGGPVHVGGQQPYGEFIQGNKYEVEGISGTGVSPGRESQVSVTQGITAEELAKLFAAVCRQIEDRLEDPDVGKTEIAETVRRIEQEAARGEEADPSEVKRWPDSLAEMAPDTVEVTIACLTNPAAGIASVIREVAERAKVEAS